MIEEMTTAAVYTLVALTIPFNECSYDSVFNSTEFNKQQEHKKFLMHC